MALTNKKQLLPLQFRLHKNLFPDCVKLIGYFASAVNVVSFDPCVGLSPIIKVSLPLLSTLIDELISAPKIMTFFHRFYL